MIIAMITKCDYLRPLPPMKAVCPIYKKWLKELEAVTPIFIYVRRFIIEALNRQRLRGVYADNLKLQVKMQVNYILVTDIIDNMSEHFFIG